jgi:Ca-activated chloride channel homolog
MNRFRIGWALAGLLALMAMAGCATETAPQKPATENSKPAPPPPPPPPPPPSVQMSAPMAGAPAPRDAKRMAMPAPIVMPPGQPAETEKYPNAAANPVKAAAQEPVSTFSIDVDTAAYANVRRFLNDGRLPPKDAVRIEEMLNYFDYAYPLPATQARPFESTVALAPSPWASGKTLLHIGLQGYTVRPKERPPLNLTLMVDVSGSMAQPDKLELAKKAFRLLVDQLEPRDKLGIVVYASEVGVKLEPTPGNEKAKILAAIDPLGAAGSTSGGSAMALAYSQAERNFQKGAVNRIIMATDGDFNVGITDPKQLQDFVERKRESGIYLSVLGFGRGNYNDALMQRLAQKGNGIAAYIDTLAEARKVFHDQMQSALLPIADDVKIQVEFNPKRVAEYRLIGYETRMLNREDFSNDRVDAGEIGAGSAVTAIYELTPPGGKTLIEPLRYQKPVAPATGPEGEVAFLRIRYKPPGAKDSILIERPITDRDAFAVIERAPEQTRWAASVAGFGQLLRQESYLDKAYGYDDVLKLAQGARGADEFGWRAEFVQLVRAAQSAQALP